MTMLKGTFEVLATFATIWLLSSLPAKTRAQNEAYLDPTVAVNLRVMDLVRRMNLRDKIGQMILDAENTIEVAPNIGSYLVGASDPPKGNTPAIWRARFNTLSANNNQRFGIPLIFATDAVHGNNIIKGATIFPHNIGLGATKNVTLIKEVAQVTAEEMITSGLDLTFAPTIAVARDIRWGRTYESYSENTELVTSYTRAFITGLQGDTAPYRLIATAKHWVGDGGTTGGIDAGDTALSYDDLMKIHGAPYLEAIKVGVGSIMVSFSSVNGVNMHSHKEMIHDVLKGQLGYEGFIMSDWEGYTRLPGNYTDQIIATVNAGVDMLMGPYQAYQIIDILTNAVDQGLVNRTRIHDAARRVLRTKIRAGLFERKVAPLDEINFKPLGIPAHRAVARQAVRESLVLLQNYGALPLQKNARILLAGKSANNIRNQCGGWTMSWQGTSEEERHLIVGGTTIMEGMEALSTGTITYTENGGGHSPSFFDAAVIVVGETPYAEFEGDSEDLSLDAEDRATIDALKDSGLPIVLVLVSGRPMIITDILNDVDAVVAAWLPGTEGDGVAQVLYGDYDFSGTLSFTWPASIDQLDSGFVGDNPDALFAYGFGRTYAEGPQQQSASPTASPTKEAATASPTDATSSPTKSPVSSLDGGTNSGDVEAPTQPKSPKLTDSSFRAISFSWEPATDNVGVENYLVYDKEKLVLTTPETNALITDLEPGTLHFLTVSAVDAAGNEGPLSQALLVSTTLLVDKFDDENTFASEEWGEWKVSHGGDKGDGFSRLQLDAPGYEDNAAQMFYSVDSGEWGFANFYLDFRQGEAIDLTQREVVGIKFKMRGQSGSTFNVQLGTPLAQWNWIYYQFPFKAAPEWSQVVLLFDRDFEPSSAKVPYTMEEAVRNATSFVWETTDVGTSGWLVIDEVELLTPTSAVGAIKEDTNVGGPNNDPSSDDGGSSASSIRSRFIGTIVPFLLLVFFGSDLC